jgi:hypothetical protein
MEIAHEKFKALRQSAGALEGEIINFESHPNVEQSDYKVALLHH